MSQPLSRRAYIKGVASTIAMAGAASAFAPAIAAAKDAFVESLIARMSLEDKAGQLSLYSDSVRTEAAFFNPTIASESKDKALADIAAGKITGLFNGRGVGLSRELQKVAVEKSPHGIPLIFAADIIHGMTTIFPIPMAEAASFDPELSRRTNRAAAVEATASAIHWTFSPAVDVVRDQRWGRAAEAAGEDTWLACRFAAARVQGFQGPDLKAQDSMLACLKHFAAYGAVEAGMDYNTVEITEPTLRQTHLPPFRAGIDAGALTVMSAFNDIGGVPSTGNRRLLSGILRGEMGFKGFVVSDFTSEEELIAHGFATDGRDAAKKAILAGCDMSMQSGIYMKYLPDLVRSGEVPVKVLDEAVRRVLHIKKAIGLFDNPYKSMDAAREHNAMRRPETIALAREAARRACVLLKNEGDVLPLKKSGQKVALIGPLASDQNQLNGYWVVFSDTKDSVTVEMAMRGVIGNHLTVVRGSDIELTDRRRHRRSDKGGPGGRCGGALHRRRAGDVGRGAITHRDHRARGPSCARRGYKGNGQANGGLAKSWPCPCPGRRHKRRRRHPLHLVPWVRGWKRHRRYSVWRLQPVGPLAMQFPAEIGTGAVLL
ncbi:Beta-hexosaminidase [Asticcacaulis sp. MM231]